MARNARTRRPAFRMRKTRRVRARRTVRAPRRRSSRAPGAFPTKRVVTLNYVQVQPISRVSSAPTIVSSYYFCANSIHDPDAQSGAPGHQPYFHDQLMLLYRNYSVLSSTCTVTMYGGPTGILFGQTDYNQVGTTEVPNDYYDNFNQSQLERPGVKQSMMGNAARPAKVTLRWNCKTAGLSRTNNTGDMGDAGVGTDPFLRNFFRFGFTMLTAPGGGDNTTLNQPNAICRMRFKVMLDNPRHVGMS